MFENQVFQFTALPFGMSLSPWIFITWMDVIVADLHQRAISLFPYLDNWLIRDLNRQQTYISHNILPSNSSKSRVHSKFKEADLIPAQQFTFIRDGISDKSTSRLHQIPTSVKQYRLKFQHKLSFFFWANSVQQQTLFS